MPSSPVDPRHPRSWCLAALLCVAAGGAAGQSVQGLRVEPSVSVGQTVTDSYRPEDGTPRRAEAIASVGAGLRMSVRGARVQGVLDYALTGQVHARDSDANELLNRLQANLLGEVVPRHLFLNVQASITQQPVSALAVQSADGSATSRNLSEVKVLSLRPTLQGRVGGIADATAAVVLTGTDTGRAGAQAQASDSINGSVALSLASTGAGRLGWDLSAVRSVVDFKTGRKTQDDRITAGLSFRPDVDWQFRLRGGADVNDFRTAERERYDSWGAGALWQPSPRTKVSLDADRRAFGHSHTVALEHRSRRTVWRYTDAQDVSRGSAETAQTLVGAYDLFFELYSSQEPDPELRARLVDGVLQRNGLTRQTQVPIGFLTSAVTLQRRQEFSVVIDAARTTWLVSAIATRSQRVDTVSGGIDDTVGGSRVRQRGLTATVTHRLTPTGAVTLVGSTIRNGGSTGVKTEFRSLSAAWTERLGARTNFSLGLRHTEYDADADPYSENAVIANLTMRF